MKQMNVRSVWLDRYLLKLGGWTWTNGTRLGTTAKLTLGTNGSCGAINGHEGKVKALQCSTRKNMGFICEHKNCESCFSLGIFRHNCRLLSGVCYVTFCGTDNWYAARATCFRYTMELATLGNEAVISQLLPLKKVSVCKQFWIGLRNTEWVHSKSPDVSAYWAIEEPSGNGKCVVAHVGIADQLSWRVCTCRSRYHFICLHYDMDLITRSAASPILTTRRVPTQRPKNTSMNSARIALNIAITSLAIVLTLVFLSGFCIYRMHRKNFKQEEDGSLGNKLTVSHEDPAGGKTVKNSETYEKRRLLSTKLVAGVFVSHQKVSYKHMLRIKIFAIKEEKRLKDRPMKTQIPDFPQKFCHLDNIEMYLEDSNSSVECKMEVIEDGWKIQCPQKSVPAEQILESSERSSWTALVDSSLMDTDINHKEYVSLKFGVTEIFADGTSNDPQGNIIYVIFDQIAKMSTQEALLEKMTTKDALADSE